MVRCTCMCVACYSLVAVCGLFDVRCSVLFVRRVLLVVRCCLSLVVVRCWLRAV